MILLLQNDFANYIGSETNTSTPAGCVISDVSFDIADNNLIVVPIRTGNATYNNPNKNSIQIIAYERFLNTLPPNLTKNIKRCDFIVYENGGDSFFILNELSTGKAANKRTDARNQLNATLSLLLKIETVKAFIFKYQRKECIISIRTKSDTSSPHDIALPFTNISNTLTIKSPNIKFQPITKLGFKLLETDIVDV